MLTSRLVFGAAIANGRFLDAMIPVLKREGIREVAMFYAVNDPFTTSVVFTLPVAAVLLLSPAKFQGIAGYVGCHLFSWHWCGYRSSCAGARQTLLANNISITFNFGYEARTLVSDLSETVPARATVS